MKHHSVGQTRYHFARRYNVYQHWLGPVEAADRFRVCRFDTGRHFFTGNWDFHQFSHGQLHLGILVRRDSREHCR
jgi:hypothetical protein